MMKLSNIMLPGLMCCISPILQAKQKPNVLFLIADDLRPELGCYGVKEIKTPNIDRLAASGILFQNAYCNIPVSGASRASLLTGMYPHYPNRFVQFDASASKDCPEAIPVSQWFTMHDYYTVSNGKVFHNIADHADSWSEYPWRVHPEGYGKDWADYNKWEVWMNSESGHTINPKTMRGPFCEWANVPDSAYDDGKGALRTIADLKRLKMTGKPFFLACGFWRPHLPFNAPRKYWDMYDRNKIPLATNPYRPTDLPGQVKPSQEIFSYARVKDTNEEAFQREAKHGYYASVSYVDAQIGLILQALDELGLRENTIVVLIGDHGWNLGEHTFWGKHNLMDCATHVPLIVRAPGAKTGKTKSMVEFVDLYPTLCELCALPLPEKQLDGKSFVPILNNPKSKIKEHVYIQWEGGDNIVDNQYSYAEWAKGKKKDCMLFDHKKDAAENHNIAGKVKPALLEHFAQLIQKIKSIIK
ncbi:iduronate-2-sulfatase [Bacteroides sedimenti]|uniref:Iduronate-2-sulfatase n=2 Tax=Bacteroides sedimenti TaxID=2136147 RepID=A0ABM8IAC2_9BACE